MTPTLILVSCRNCEGTGEIPVPSGVLHPESFHDEVDMAPCPECKGSGWAMPDYPEGYELYLTLASERYDWPYTLNLGPSQIVYGEGDGAPRRLRAVAIQADRADAQLARYLSGLHGTWTQERLQEDLAAGYLVERRGWVREVSG